jgi:hypothetical protein
MVKFGFSIGDHVALMKAVADVSGLDEDALKEAELDFFETED